MALPRHAPGQPVVGAWIGRDELVLAWCVGVAIGQLEVTAMAIAAALLALVLEDTVLFRMHLRDPEVVASRVLGPDYP
jgi:hypothetical protein